MRHGTGIVMVLSVLLVAACKDKPEPSDGAASEPDGLHPFESCPAAERFADLDIARDASFSGDAVTLDETYLRCLPGPVTDASDEDDAYTQFCLREVRDNLSDMEAIIVNDFLDSVLASTVDCDVDLDVVCGPVHPEEVSEIFNDDDPRCCYLVEVAAVCSY